MRLTLLRSVSLVLALLVAGCTENPVTTDLGSPAWAISDAAHSGLDHFYFLPPMVPDPAATGAFDASQSPVVIIDDLDAGTQIAEFTMTTGPGSETVRVVPADQHYIVNWHTDEFGLDDTHTYRIRVLVDETELGYADVDVVNSGSELRHVETGAYVALKDGRTLPIKFRIEEGALLVLRPEGGILTEAGGAVTMGFAPDAVSAPVSLTVEPAAGFPLPEYFVPNTAFDFGPDGLVFTEPATLAITYDEVDLPAGIDETNLELHKLVAGAWEPVSGSTVDTETNTVDGAVEGFSTYAIIGVIRLPFPLAQLLFASNRDGDYEIYMMYSDGSGLTQLTDNDATDWMPAVTRDGSKIAFSSDRDGDFDIYVMNADGSGLANVTDSPPGDDLGPAWDPSGSRVAYSSDRSGFWQIWLTYVPTASTRRLGRLSAAFKAGASWANNYSVYYHRDDGLDGSYDIYFLQVYESTRDFPSSLSNGPANEVHPERGNGLVFASDRTGDFEIFLRTSSSGPLVNLTNDPAIDTGPTWSPDRSFLAFERFADQVSTGDIYIIRPDGTGLRQITDDPADDRMPAWRNPQ